MNTLQGDARLLAGFWLGVLGVLIFAITLPATRLATGTDAARPEDGHHRSTRSPTNNATWSNGPSTTTSSGAASLPDTTS